jgi:hypothetical protein
MPKKPNMKKAAAAATQNWAAIQEAKTSGGLFGAVTKQLGNGGYQVTLRAVATKGARTTVQATPRGLFGKGVMRIAVGHVVLLAGDLAPVDQVQRPLEIVGRLDDRAEIKELITLGFLPADVLATAETAGAVETTRIAEEELFEAEDSDEDFWTQGMADVKGGLKAERKAQETAATIAARVAGLKGARTAAASGIKRKGVDGGVEVGDVTDAAVYEDPAYERFKRWRAYKATTTTARAMAGGGGGSLQPEAVQTVAELMAQFKLEAETARMAAENAAIASRADAVAHAFLLRTQLAGKKVLENWDDEVDMDDL